MLAPCTLCCTCNVDEDWWGGETQALHDGESLGVQDVN
jgi:hypothetical protein